MAFMDNIKDTLGNEYNVSVTENGALGYKTTNNPFVDINFKVSSFRNADTQKITKAFQKCFHTDANLALRWLFFARDIREGMGERRLFREIMKYLADNYPYIAKLLIPYIPEYGRYDDLLCLLDTSLCSDVLTYISNVLLNDINAMEHNKPCSLLAKWLPSQNASCKKTCETGQRIARSLRMTSKQYRQTLSKLRNYTSVTENIITTQGWGAVDYSRVPSKANLKYEHAFFKHDPKRRRSYLDSLISGKTHINASVLYPHEIVKKYGASRELNETLEALWNSLIAEKPSTGNTLVVRDGSYSMVANVGNGVCPLDIATALTVYFAQLAEGEFHNKFITFSAYPELVELKDMDTLHDKLRFLETFNDCSTTDMERVFNLILDTAVKHNLKQEDLPERLLIVSDMEFNAACCNPDKRLFKVIGDRFAEHGYKLPKLIFWNIHSRTETIPLKENELGVALVSGYSPNILKMVMSEELDPFKILLETLKSPRYDFVNKVLNKLTGICLTKA